MPEPADRPVDRKVQVRCHELAPVIGDRDGNLRVIDDAVQDAMAAGCQLLVLPELATSGYHQTAEEARAAALPASSPGRRRDPRGANELASRVDPSGRTSARGGAGYGGGQSVAGGDRLL